MEKIDSIEKTLNVDIPVLYLINIALGQGSQHVWACDVLEKNGYGEELKRKRQIKKSKLMGRLADNLGNDGMKAVGRALKNMAAEVAE